MNKIDEMMIHNISNEILSEINTIIEKKGELSEETVKRILEKVFSRYLNQILERGNS